VADQFDVYCEAPPYAVVRACEKGGFRSPLGVRWRHVVNVLAVPECRVKGIWGRMRQWLFPRSKPKGKTCSCGHSLPALRKYGFTFLSKKVGDYLLGQCARCRTIYWDVALPLPDWNDKGVLKFTDSLEI